MASTAVLDYGASVYDILRYELGLSDKEVREIMEELSEAEND